MGAFGGQITQLAIPLTAVLTLHASAAQMGVLGAVDRAPYLVFGLLVGVWIDRRRRRPVLLGAAALEALLLISVPAAALIGALALPQLYGVGFLAGTANLAFEVAGMALLPAVIARDRLVEGNTKLQAAESAAGTAGPPLAGLLVQLLTAPIAILVDGAATVLKIPLLVGLPAEPPPVASAQRGVWHELKEGLELVLGSPILRSIAATTGTSNLFYSAFSALYVLFIVRDLHLTPAQVGLVFAADGPGAMLAVFLARRLARRVGVGRAILVGAFGFGTANFLVPWLPRGWVLTLPILLVAQAVGPGSGVLYNINQVSLRQAITPDRLQGRMGATMRFIVWGVIPIGALAGGLLGQAVGLRPALWISAAGGPLSLLPLLLGGIHRLREAPLSASERS